MIATIFWIGLILFLSSWAWRRLSTYRATSKVIEILNIDELDWLKSSDHKALISRKFYELNRLTHYKIKNFVGSKSAELNKVHLDALLVLLDRGGIVWGIENGNLVIYDDYHSGCSDDATIKFVIGHPTLEIVEAHQNLRIVQEFVNNYKFVTQTKTPS